MQLDQKNQQQILHQIRSRDANKTRNITMSIRQIQWLVDKGVGITSFLLGWSIEMHDMQLKVHETCSSPELYARLPTIHLVCSSFPGSVWLLYELQQRNGEDYIYSNPCYLLPARLPRDMRRKRVVRQAQCVRRGIITKGEIWFSSYPKEIRVPRMSFEGLRSCTEEMCRPVYTRMK